MTVNQLRLWLDVEVLVSLDRVTTFHGGGIAPAPGFQLVQSVRFGLYIKTVDLNNPVKVPTGWLEMRPVATQAVSAQRVVTGIHIGVFDAAVDGADGQRNARLIMAAVGLDVSIQVTADLKRRHVVIVFRGLSAEGIVIPVLLTAAINHSSPPH
ncbi:hypothetical protein D3C86_1443310 [compost metagenome]